LVRASICQWEGSKVKFRGGVEYFKHFDSAKDSPTLTETNLVIHKGCC